MTTNPRSPPVYREGYMDANDTKWSIEVLPCDGESREDCQKRISKSFEGLLRVIEEGTAIDYLCHR